jgi:site-specific DNA-methyltransferase (adenine-specific)
MKQLQTLIKQGDCLEILKDYPDDFFDLIITSPPYANQRKSPVVV